MIAAEVMTAADEIEVNIGSKAINLRMPNMHDRPVKVASNYHFVETNSALSVDRDAARGMRLDIAAGTAVRFEPGQTRDVTLAAMGGGARFMDLTKRLWEHSDAKP